MIHAINTHTLTRLRDYLLDAGSRKSIVAVGAEAYDQDDPLAGDDDAKAYFDAVAEAMFLMVAVDGVVRPTERDVLRGALRELTAGMLRSVAIDALVSRFDDLLQAEGQAKRLTAVCDVLRDRPEAAEAAFVLSAAVAFADNEIADEENEILNDLADRLGIDETRADALLDELDPPLSV